MEALNSEFVYVIGASQEHQKIGRSNDPQKRLYGLQTSNHHHLRLLYVQPTPFAGAIERIVHHWLREFRIRGEWYNCSPSYAASAVATCAKEYMEDAARLHHVGDIVRAVVETDVLTKGHLYTVSDYEWRRGSGRVDLLGIKRTVEARHVHLVQSAPELLEETRIARDFFAKRDARWALQLQKT